MFRQDKNYSTPTITDVALMIAYASLPTSSPNSFTAAIEMVEEITLPPPISISCEKEVKS